MELKQYFSIVRRWAWLLILGFVLGAAGGYFWSVRQPRVYQATTRALVMRPPLEQSSDMTYYSDLQLVQTYMQLLTTQPVLDAASARLGYAVHKGQIKVQQSGDTHVLIVTIEDNNSQHAADIANVLVEVMIEQNETLQKGRYLSTEESIQAQIDQVQSQINSLQLQVDNLSTQSLQDQLVEVKTQIKPLEDEVSTLQQEIAALDATVATIQTAKRPDSAALLTAKTQIAEKQARIDQVQPLLNLYQQIYSNLVVLGKPVDAGSNADSRMTRLQSTLDLYQNLYLNLLNSLETVRLARLQNTPNVVQIERAAKPLSEIRPRPVRNAGMAAALGFMLAAGIIFLVEYLDDSLKSPEDVEQALGVPVLGFVADMRYKRKEAEQVYVARQPRSPVSEAFRTLRTNLEFSAVQGAIRTILVTSAGPGEGKTTVAVNLAAIIALSGKRVVLLDADLRRPYIHRLFGLPNREGLSNLFRNQERASSVSRSKLDLTNLTVITSGSLPPNPAELLGSERMSQILADLRGQVDFIVIDTPPSLVADAQILASKVDAVLFVIQPGLTHTEAARAAFEQFKRGGARIVGAVLNRIPRNRSDYYGGYKYYSTYKSKGYYTRETPDGSKTPAKKPEPVQQPEAGPSYSFLSKLAKMSGSEELPPPDVPRK